MFKTHFLLLLAFNKKFKFFDKNIAELKQTNQPTKQNLPPQQKHSSSWIQ